MTEAVEQTGPNCFVFRTSPVEYVQEELRKGRLRQGWSPPGTSLLDDDGNPRTREDWTKAYVEAWGQQPSPRSLGILRRMLNIQAGDLVLCPKAPVNGQFTIANVWKPYRFEVAEGQGDFGHIITVQNQRVVSNAYNQDSLTISDLFRSAYFMSRVTEVQQYKRQAVLYGATQLLQDQGHTTVPGHTDGLRQQIYDDSRRMAAKAIMDSLAQWSFSQFEAAVGHAFQRKGYERLGGNITKRSEDGEINGDADHVFSIPMAGFEEFEAVSVPVLIVQVKHHQDESDAQGVRQLINWQAPEDSGWEVWRRVLFSSADDFTEECRLTAHTEDVTLMCGIDAGLFML